MARLFRSHKQEPEDVETITRSAHIPQIVAQYYKADTVGDRNRPAE